MMTPSTELNYYVLLEDNLHGVRAWGPLDDDRVLQSYYCIKSTLEHRGWKVTELLQPDDSIAALATYKERILSLEVLPENYYQPDVWQRAVKLREELGPLYSDVLD